MIDELDRVPFEVLAAIGALLEGPYRASRAVKEASWDRVVGTLGRGGRHRLRGFSDDSATGRGSGSRNALDFCVRKGGNPAAQRKTRSTPVR
eukprot:g13812.t1